MRKYFAWDQGLGQQVLYKCKWFFTTSAEKSIKTKEHIRGLYPGDVIDKKVAF